MKYLDLLRAERNTDIHGPWTAQTAKSAASDFTQFMQSSAGGKIGTADPFMDAAIAAGNHHRWRINLLGGLKEVIVSPPASVNEVRATYPEATAIEPIREAVKQRATAAEEVELRALLRRIGAAGAWPASEVEEAITFAVADTEAALQFWRRIAMQQGIDLRGDGRIFCLDCRRLDRGPRRDGFRRCGAARRGELRGGHGRDFSPVLDLPRRCIAYAPRAITKSNTMELGQ